MPAKRATIKRVLGSDRVEVVIDHIRYTLSFYDFRIMMEDGINVLQSFIAERNKPKT